ncbi:MAG TPA: ribonuclease PH [Phycisphaerae bacterium]|nr:ribonuclease PH [Phycisphaerae bacterium]
MAKAARRVDGRKNDELRPIRIVRGYTKAAAGSVLIQSGDTHILCTATVEEKIPEWRKSSGLGWVTAEYDMLPAATGERKRRNRGGKIDGRVQEIQRLIGRSLRAIVDTKKLGPRTIWIDCDVLQADGGTRTASITGAYVALVDALRTLEKKKLVGPGVLNDSVSAVSVGLLGDRVLLDLCYVEDKDAHVDFNVVVTGRGQYVEVQGAAEAGTFTPSQMNRILKVAGSGVKQLQRIQEKALGRK